MQSILVPTLMEYGTHIDMWSAVRNEPCPASAYAHRIAIETFFYWIRRWTNNATTHFELWHDFFFFLFVSCAIALPFWLVKIIVSFPHSSTNRRAPKKCARCLGKRTIIKWLGIADQIHFHISLGIYEQKNEIFMWRVSAECRPTTTVLSIRFNIISIVHCSVPVVRVRVYFGSVCRSSLAARCI